VDRKAQFHTLEVGTQFGDAALDHRPLEGQRKIREAHIQQLFVAELSPVRRNAQFAPPARRSKLFKPARSKPES
jgi:hypothetical protein